MVLIKTLMPPLLALKFGRYIRLKNFEFDIVLNILRNIKWKDKIFFSVFCI